MIPNPWIILGIVVAWLASLAGVGYWQNEAGHTDERVLWQTKESKELKLANFEIQRLNDKARKAESDGAANVAAIGAELEQEKRNHAKTRVARDTALRSGHERVSVAVAGCESPGGGGRPETAAGSGESPAARAYLHPEVAANLEQLAGEADDTARDLNACLAVTAEDRRIINQDRNSP